MPASPVLMVVVHFLDFMSHTLMMPSQEALMRTVLEAWKQVTEALWPRRVTEAFFFLEDPDDESFEEVEADESNAGELVAEEEEDEDEGELEEDVVFVVEEPLELERCETCDEAISQILIFLSAEHVTSLAVASRNCMAKTFLVCPFTERTWRYMGSAVKRRSYFVHPMKSFFPKSASAPSS